MRLSIRATGRVVQWWMGQAARQQAKRISVYMTLTPVLVGTLNTGTTCVARRGFFRGGSGSGRGRDSFLATREPNPKWGVAKDGVGGGVSSGDVRRPPMVTFHVEHGHQETPFPTTQHLDPKSPGGKNLPISCRNPSFQPTICYQMRSELENGPAQA